jgi:hypothetical protein
MDEEKARAIAEDSDLVLNGYAVTLDAGNPGLHQATLP